MNFMEVYITNALAILAIMLLLWVLSLLLRNSSIVDIFWGTGFVVSGWVYFALTPGGMLARKWLVVLLVTLWGLRLSLYLLWRNWGKAEDYRYQAWRTEAGPKWWWFSFFKVFLLQGVLIWLISSPLLAAQISPTPAQLIWLDYLAVIVWGVGFFFEAAGDWQLARFKAKPENKGRLLNSGVWRYTRHPNYFGDATQWWAFYLLALAAGGWWTIFSPALMNYLLRAVSGVTMLEKTIKDAKPGYQQYVESTNAFIPWFPHQARKGSDKAQ